MNIGLDGKRAFHNQTGLGQYSRAYIDELAKGSNNLFLFEKEGSGQSSWSPKPSCHLIKPSGPRMLWRTVGMAQEPSFKSLDIYHGLSHEIPIHPKQQKPKLVVTMHDCIFKRYPKHYGWWDRKVYHQKWKYAVQRADAIVSISKATADDLIRFYKADAAKIHINPLFADKSFHHQYSGNEIQTTLNTIPFSEYFLFVGTHHPRKNLELVLQVYAEYHEQFPPLLIIGTINEYQQQFIKENRIEGKIFSSEIYYTQEQLAHLYTKATALLYTSYFEGFGLPVLEAMKCGCPVIASRTSSIPEVGGDAILYCSPSSSEELVKAMQLLSNNALERASWSEKALERSNQFSAHRHVAQSVELYHTLLL